MTRDEIHTAVVEAIAEAIRPAKLSAVPGPRTELTADLSLDSIQMMSLVVELENKFEICFEPEDEQGIRTLDDLAEVILAHRGRKLKGAA